MKERKRMTRNTLKWYCSVLLITLLLGSLRKYSGEAFTPLSTETSPSPWSSQEMNAPMRRRGAAPPAEPRHSVKWTPLCSLEFMPRKCCCHLVSQKYTQRRCMSLDCLLWGVPGSGQQWFVGMAEGTTLNFALKPAICFTFNKGVIAPLIIMELFLTGV